MRTAPPEGSSRSYPRWVVRLARLVLSIFFSRVELVGARHLEGLSGPRLYVANHNNGLVDPLLVIGLLPGRPRFLAKATLWKNPFVHPFLALGRVIPVFRRQDPGFDPARNEETFSRCRAVLATGGSVALFPEGRSHSEPGLAEVRTGAARILVGGDPALAEVAVVPVGLLFEAADRFRSSVLVRIGTPFSPRSLRGSTGPPGVRELTERIESALQEVTLGYASWEEARLLERAVDVYLRQEPELPVPAGLAERDPWRRGFLAAYRSLQAQAPDELAPLARAVDRYDRLLRAFALTDPQVAALYPARAVSGWAFRTLVLLGMLFPLAAVGTLASYVPYRICGWLGGLVARDPDQPATYKLFGGLVLFPVAWALETAIAWRVFGPGGAIVALLVALAGSWAALRFRDRWGSLWREGRAYLLLRSSDRLRDELGRRRRAIRDRLSEMVERLSAP